MAIAFHANLYIPTHSMVHRWAARPKLLSLLTLMFAIALIQHLVILPWALLVVGLLYGLARLPLSYLMGRLPYPGFFIAATVGVLPWVTGHTVLWEWGWLALKLEGLQSAGLIAGRFLAILVVSFVLLGTTPFLDILEALRSMRVPAILTDMALLTYRYLFDIAAQLATMRQAMQLRGYGSRHLATRQQWLCLAALFGSLLLRSYEQSQQIYKAMRLRGYGQGIPQTQRRQTVTSTSTALMTGATLVAALMFIVGEFSLSHL